MVNDICVKTDGVEVPRENILCSVDNGEYWFTLQRAIEAYVERNGKIIVSN